MNERTIKVTPKWNDNFISCPEWAKTGHTYFTMHFTEQQLNDAPNGCVDYTVYSNDYEDYEYDGGQYDFEWDEYGGEDIDINNNKLILDMLYFIYNASDENVDDYEIEDL